MRVALISSEFPPEGSNGGGNTFYWELSRALVQEGHKVLVATLTLGDERKDYVDGVEVFRCHFDPDSYANLNRLEVVPVLSYALSRAIALYRSAMPAVECFAPDVIEFPDFGFSGLMWALDHKYPLVVRCLCPYSHVMEMGFGGPYFKLDTEVVAAVETAVIGAADARTTTSESLAAILSAKTGIAEADFTVIGNPIGQLNCASENGAMEEMPSGSPLLLYFGRVEYLKGCDLIVEALPSVIAEFPNARLLMVGRESPEVGASRGYGDVLRARLDELGISDKVDFLGSIERGRLQRMLTRVDMCVLPSRFDNSPYACLESMRAGVPLVATDVGGVPEYVSHGRSGWLVQPDNARALAQGIIALVRDEELRQTMSKAGPVDLMVRCESRLVARQSIDVYERAVQSCKANFSRSNMAMSAAIARLGTAFDDLLETPYLEDRFRAALNTRYKEGAEEAWNEAYERGFADGQKAFLRKVFRPLSPLFKAVKPFLSRKQD